MYAPAFHREIEEAVVWFVEQAEDVCIERLIARHITYGKERALARAWVPGSDPRKAELIATSRHRADLRLGIG